MPVQLPNTTNGVKKVVKSTSHMEIPSSPTKYEIPTEVIHSYRSANCMAAVDGSYVPNKTKLATKTPAEPTRLTQRTSFSLGKTNTINANIAGKKIKLVNMDYPAKNTNMIVATTPSATNMAYCCIFPVCNDFNPVAELLTNSLAL